MRAPEGSPDTIIAAFFERKKFWIYQKLAAKKLLIQEPPEKEFVSGEGFSYLGRTYKLILVDTGEPLRLYRGHFELNRKYAHKGKETFIAWYRSHAEKIIKERIERYQSRFSQTVTGIRVMDLKYRWGSCTAAHRLNFHWKMILTPMRIVDYIVVHEMAHMVEKNHTPEFWHIIALVLPDYETRKDWLDKNGKDLDI